jgi:hypothetical protein
VRPNSLAAVALGASIWMGGSVLADGAGDASSACYSYREAKARWPGAYMTWRYDSRKWQCWAPRGVSRSVLRGTPHKPQQLRGADDIAPEFPQPSALRIVRTQSEPPSTQQGICETHFCAPEMLGWAWEAMERVQTQPLDEIVAPPVTIYSTFDGEPPDVWPAQSKTAGSGLPAVLLLALLAGGGLTMTTAGLLAIRWRP